MRILLVANVAKELVLKFNMPTLEYLKKQGHIVDVACADAQIVQNCHEKFAIPLKRTPYSFGTLRAIIKLKSIIKTREYDVVYCHTPVGGCVARLAARKLRKSGLKVVYFSHGYHFYKGAPLLNWVLYYTLEKIMARWTDAIITINQEDYNNTVKRLKCKNTYKLDGIGVDINRFAGTQKISVRQQYREQLGIPDDAIVMVYLAELIPNKNQKLLIDGLLQLREWGYNYYLVLAGIDYNHGRELQYANGIGVKDYVKYLGWREDIENLYAMSDICTASSIREGFGINIVEAMASGLPVVATNNRGHVTIIRDGVNGLLVPLGKPELMAKKILFAMQNKDELLSHYSLKQYESSEIVRNIEKILQDTVDMRHE